MTIIEKVINIKEDGREKLMGNSSIDIYDMLGAAIEEQTEYIKQPSRIAVVFKKLGIWLKIKHLDILVGIGYFISLYWLAFIISRCIWSIYYLDYNIVPSLKISVIYGIFIPLFTWLISTCRDFWSYKNKKMLGLTIVISNASMIILSLILIASESLLLPLILKIPTSQDIAPSMVLTLARCVMALVQILSAIGIYRSIFKNMFDEKTVELIMYYRFNRRWDTRKNKHYQYDLNIVRYMSNGKMHRIYEEDRFLHCMSVGTTGTGKTATCLEVAINNDLDQRVSNEDWQKRKLSKLLKRGKIRMVRDFDDSDFSAYYFKADSPRYKRKLKKIQEKSMPVGITAMAPNENFSDKLYKLSKAKSIKVNRIDPNIESGGQHKEGFIGFNPLYISPKLEGIHRKLEIFSKARVFADVNQAIFEKDESGDIYFTGLNRNITTSITVMVLLTYPSLNNGRQPTPDIVQDIINDFDKAKLYRDELVRLYSTKFNRREESKDPIMDVGGADIGEYQFILDVIDYDILGNGRKQMQDQARGLRNIINETLSNPLIRKVLCAENTIDLDEALDKGEITFINYAINLGSAGTAFGMFYLLSFINAVLRRPAGKKLLPHFCYIDELPELLHPELGRTFALFRQYKVGMFVALQSLDQLEKSPKTKYLKNVVLGGCSQQVVFGRCSAAEMKIYQEFAGTKNVTVEMTGRSETSLSMENTSMSTMHRETNSVENYMEGADMRYREFREVTMFTVTKGSPEKPFYGKTFFLEDVKKIKIRRFVFNWSKYFVPSEGFIDETDDVIPLSKNALKDSSTSVEEHNRVITIPRNVQPAIINTEKRAETVVQEQTRSINDNSNIASEICLSSGKNRVEQQQENIVADDTIDVVKSDLLFDEINLDALIYAEEEED